ncbi:MAG: alpha/beta fold hydrolase [Chloroflexota bacterium]
MRYLLLAAAMLSITAVLVIFYQYWMEMSAIRQRVLSGSEILSTDYGEIEYAVRGEGSPVLLINGSGGGYDQALLFGDLMLGDGFKKIGVSRFGYLRSPVPDDPTVERQAALYAALLDHLGVDKVNVIAMSGGGPSGLQFAHDFPNRTSGLVLASAVTKAMPPGEQNATSISIIQTIQRSDFLFWLVARAFQTQFLAMIGIPADVYESFTAEEKEMAQQVLDVMHPMAQRYPGSAREGEQKTLDSAAMGEISAPTLIFHAKDDNLVVYEHAENAGKSIKQSALVAFETGGHGMLPQMKGVRAALSSFLAEMASK